MKGVYDVIITTHHTNNTMNINWFKNPDNVIYADINEFADNFGKEVGIPTLRENIESFRKNPSKEGIQLKGKKRSYLKLLIPNQFFNTNIEMGDSIWVYLGENYSTYCLYWPE